MGGGASNLQPEATTYYAKVPPNAKPGDVISADINGRPVKVRVPPGTSVGQLFRFSATDCVTTPSAPAPTSSVPTQPPFSQAPLPGPSSATRAPAPTSAPVLTAYNDNPQPGMHYTTNPNHSGRPVLTQPTNPAPTGAQMVQQIYAPPQQTQMQPQQQQPTHLTGAQMVQQLYAPPQQTQMQPQQQQSTAHLTGAQIVQQVGYHQQPQQLQRPQQQIMMMPVNTPFPQQNFQQQPHYMMVPQQHMMMPQQQVMMPQQQMMMPQQQMMMPQQQYAYAPQMFMMQQPMANAVQPEIPVATPIQDGYHGATLNR